MGPYCQIGASRVVMGDVTADEFDNRNVAFLNGKGFWVFYIATILVFRYLLFAIPILHWRHCAWTVVHQIHTAVRLE